MAELNTSEKSNSSGRRRMDTRVDLTAMVDLAFLLITFFMLTTSLSKPRIMPINMPVGTNEGGVKASSTLSICLGKDNQILWYTGTELSPSALSLTNFEKSGIRELLLSKMKEVYQQTGRKLFVVVKPSDHSQYKNLVDLIDELSITQVPSYAIADISAGDIEKLKNKKAY